METIHTPVLSVPILDANGNKLFSFRPQFYKFLQRCKTKINTEDTQVLGILWGGVGCGKSVLAQKIAYTITNKLSLDKIAFSKNEFIQAVLVSEREVIIADEGIAIFFGRGAMTKEGRLMAELMAQIRVKNLFVLICVPDILSIDAMVLAQANFIAHVYESREIHNNKLRIIKGNVNVYPDMAHYSFKDNIIRWLKLKRSNPMYREKKPPFYCRQKGDIYHKDQKDGGFYAVDKDAYITKKLSVFDKYKKEIEKTERKRLRGKKEYDYLAIDNDLANGLSKDDVRRKYKISQSQLYTYLRNKAKGLV